MCMCQFLTREVKLKTLLPKSTVLDPIFTPNFEHFLTLKSDNTYHLTIEVGFFHNSSFLLKWLLERDETADVSCQCFVLKFSSLMF